MSDSVIKINRGIDILSFYPIGSIYLSTMNTDPSTIFGGSWQQIQDKFLLCAGVNHTAGDTGGEATHVLTVSEMPSHTHTFTGTQVSTTGTSKTLTGRFQGTQNMAVNVVNSNIFVNPTGIMSEDNSQNVNQVRLYGDYHRVTPAYAHVSGVTINLTHSHTYTASGSNGNSGSSSAHNNMPPYKVVYIWQRTA